MSLVKGLSDVFRSNANKNGAKSQAAYMRNQFPFLGLSSPDRKSLEKEIFKKYPPDSSDSLHKTISELWNKNEREFQYAAMDLAIKHQSKITDLEFIRALIAKKSWWDTVDCLAPNLLGNAILADKSKLSEMDDWIRDENFWIRRSAILFQLKWKSQTDKKRLFSYCLQCAEEKEFFIQKAIGWALRQYGKTDSKAVKEFLKKNDSKLSKLSVKEKKMSYLFGEAYKAKFDAAVYLSTYYSTADGSSREGNFLPWVLENLHEISTKIPDKNNRCLIDFGSGLIIQVAMIFSSKFDRIYLAEYAEQNREALRKWLEWHPTAHDWTPILEAVAKLEQTTPDAIEKRLREKIKQILPCDITLPPLKIPFLAFPSGR